MKHLILLTTSDRPAVAWDAAMCGRQARREGISEAAGEGWRGNPRVRLPVCEDQERTG